MSDKMRADVALVSRGLCESREKAQASIMAGLVYVGERKILKASESVKPEDTVVIPGDFSWGIDLEEALPDFRFIENLP